MSDGVWVKGLIAKSSIDYVKEKHGDAAFGECIAKLSDRDRIAVNSGGNVPIASMGAFNQAFVDVVCRGDRLCAEREFRAMGAASADQLLQGNGIFSLFARFASPKQVFARAESVVKTAYPGVVVKAELNDRGDGGTIVIDGVSGYPYGSQRIVGWLLRGIEIVGGTGARVSEGNWNAGRIDSPTYEITASWKA
jgi:hypothetical protein